MQGYCQGDQRDQGERFLVGTFQWQKFGEEAPLSVLHDLVFSFSASIGLIKICHITRFKGRPCSGKKRIYNCQGMQSVMKKFLDYICGNMVSSKTTMFDIKKNTLSRSSSSPSKKAQKFAILLSFGESLFIPSTDGPDDRKHHACQLQLLLPDRGVWI